MNREALIEHLQKILEPLVAAYANIGSFGNRNSCYGPNISWFEMFCRSSYGIIAYTKATGNTSHLQAFSKTLLQVIQDNRFAGFKNYDQKAVELVPVATLLLLHRNETWDTYSIEQRKALTHYFENINKIRIGNNNWILFRILVCTILQKLTGKSYEKIVNKGWSIIDKCYQGEGWYRDGLRGTEDYYNAFGFHFYSLLYYYLTDNYERKENIKERALSFAHQFKFFFDNDGRSIPYGRSLIYRYAPLSFWSMMVVNQLLSKSEEIEAITIIRKNFNWWLLQDVYDTNGIQYLGYSYPNECMLEAYNSSGSPYWSLKFFLILLKDGSSHIWKKETECYSTPIHSNHCLAKGNILISTTALGNIAYINPYHGSGQKQDFAKYMHFAYCSATGFNINPGLANRATLSDDSSLIFDISGREKKRSENLLYHCYQCNGLFIQNFAWRADKKIKIHTTLVPIGKYHVRIHIINSKKSCICYETGFAVNAEEKRDYLCEKIGAVISTEYVSYIFSFLGNGSSLSVQNEGRSNIYNKNSAMPAIRYDLIKGRSVLVDIIGIEGSEANLSGLYNLVKKSININNNKLSIINTDGSLCEISLKTQYVKFAIFDEIYSLAKDYRRCKSLLKRVVRTFV